MVASVSVNGVIHAWLLEGLVCLAFGVKLQKAEFPSQYVSESTEVSSGTEFLFSD